MRACPEFQKINPLWRIVLDRAKGPAPVWRRNFRSADIRMYLLCGAGLTPGHEPDFPSNRSGRRLRDVRPAVEAATATEGARATRITFTLDSIPLVFIGTVGW